MRESIYSHGTHRIRHRQREDNLSQNYVQSSRLQNRRKGAKFVIICLFFCLLTWTLSNISMVYLPISTKWLSKQEPTRGILFQLFRHHNYSQIRNMTLMTLNPMHQRIRNHLLDENSLDTSRKHLLGSPTQEMIYEDNFRDKDLDDHQEPSPSNQVDLGRWPILGGLRESELDIQPFYVKVPISFGNKLQEYFMHIDTGSGITWVMCKGRGPITAVGPNGLFKPNIDSFLNCKRVEELCKAFQEDDEYPCDVRYKFRCIFAENYGDGLAIEGHIITEDVFFEASDGSKLQAHIAFGCADKVDDENTRKDGQKISPTDGLIGLGPHEASWLHQLNLLGLVSENVIAICFEPTLHGTSQVTHSHLPEHAGFLSFGNLFSAQATNTIWTANILSDSKKHESMYSGRLVGIKYHETILMLKEDNGEERDIGIQMGFDTGSDLTYFTAKTFDTFVAILDKDARRMGYTKTQDSREFVREERRRCWLKKGEKMSMKDFGDLILMFSSLAGDDTTSNLIIKPKYYITTKNFGKHPRTCFNVLKETEFNFGNLGAEFMKGHLILFNNNLNQIGWRAVKSCKNLK